MFCFKKVIAGARCQTKSGAEVSDIRKTESFPYSYLVKVNGKLESYTERGEYYEGKPSSADLIII